jgi:hypothetical protein
MQALRNNVKSLRGYAKHSLLGLFDASEAGRIETTEGIGGHVFFC